MATPAVNPEKVTIHAGGGKSFHALHDTLTAIVDIIERRYDEYRAADLPGPAVVVYGEPLEISSFPCIAVFPDEGEFDEPGGCGSYVSIDRIRVKVYWSKYEGVDSNNNFPELVKAIDGLVLLFKDHRTLADEDGAHRVSRCRPIERSFGAVEELRGDNRIHYLQAADLTLEVKGYTWKP